MPANFYQYYPTGFRVPLDDSAKQEIACDAELQSLLVQYQNRKLPLTAFTSYDPLIVLAKKLIGNFVDFLDANDTNSKISEQGYLFLADCVEFINTGKRTVSINSRIAIMQNEFASGQYENPNAVRRRTMLRNQLAVPAVDFIFAWVRHRGGLTDMLCTLQFLFATDFRNL